MCNSCIDNYYIDNNDGKCKSNQEENDFKYCTIADNNICLNFTFGYELGKDNKCSNTKYCAESSNGICISCIDNYYLGVKVVKMIFILIEQIIYAIAIKIMDHIINIVKQIKILENVLNA